MGLLGQGRLLLVHHRHRPPPLPPPPPPPHPSHPRPTHPCCHIPVALAAYYHAEGGGREHRHHPQVRAGVPVRRQREAVQAAADWVACLGMAAQSRGGCRLLGRPSEGEKQIQSVGCWHTLGVPHATHQHDEHEAHSFRVLTQRMDVHLQQALRGWSTQGKGSREDFAPKHSRDTQRATPTTSTRDSAHTCNTVHSATMQTISDSIQHTTHPPMVRGHVCSALRRGSPCHPCRHCRSRA